MGFINSTSTKLPFANDSFDRVLALESAQHFKPLSDFISESKRILTKSGLLVMAVPVIIGNPSIRKLGLLKFTWSSEHYGLDTIKTQLNLVDSVYLKKNLLVNLSMNLWPIITLKTEKT